MITIDSKEYKTYEFDDIYLNENHGFIYITINKINNKSYIGKKELWKGKNPRTYLGSGTLLKKAINKYGEENFERFIIDLSKTKEELNAKEIWYIDSAFGSNVTQHINWYNIALGGNGGNAFSGKTEEEMDEIRKKLRENSGPKKGFSRSKKVNKGQSETRKRNNNFTIPTIPCIIYKDGKELGTFVSIEECTIYLESKIEGKLRQGISKLLTGWIPTKNGKLYGYSAKTINIEEYKKIKQSI
jgi:hypothetical protein